MLDRVINLATSQFLKQAEKTIRKAHKEGRVVFRKQGKVEYTNKNGEKFIGNMDETAQRLLDTLSLYLTSQVGDDRANPVTIGVTVGDIREILEKVRVS